MSTTLILGQLVFAVIASIAAVIYMDKSYDKKHPREHR